MICTNKWGRSDLICLDVDTGRNSQQSVRGSFYHVITGMIHITNSSRHIFLFLVQLDLFTVSFWSHIFNTAHITWVLTQKDSFKTKVSFAKEPCKRDYILQKRPTISARLTSLERWSIRWLRLVWSLQTLGSFTKEPYKRDYILQKRPIILRSLLIIATPSWVWVWGAYKRDLHWWKGAHKTTKETYIDEKRPI